MREMYRDVEVSGKTYRIKKMTPFVASRIHGLMVSVGLKLMQSQSQETTQPEERTAIVEKVAAMDPQKIAEGTVETFWTLASTELEEKLYVQIQAQCMRVCAYQVNPNEEVFTDVQMGDGRWAAPGLSDDPLAVSELIVNALKLNISPFFLKAAPAMVEAASLS